MIKHKKALTFQPELLFICNFLSSSIGFIPYSCFHRFTFVFIFRFNILGFPLHRFLCFASSFFPPDSSLPFVCVNSGFWLLNLCFCCSLLFLTLSNSNFVSAHLPLSLPMFSPLPSAWSLMHSFTVLLLGSTDGFFSFYPASLPQLFHRRSPLDFSFGADAWLLLSFVHFSFSIPLLGSLFLPFHLFLFPSHSDFLSARFPLSFLTSSPLSQS